MYTFTILFVSVLLLNLFLEWFLAHRHIACIRHHRASVPADFADKISLEEHQKAADYTSAKTIFNVYSAVVSSAFILIWTIGGGLDLLDKIVRYWGWNELWTGTVFILSVFIIIHLLELPLSLWRTFNLEKRFGFNRMSPRLFLVDTIKTGVLFFLIGIPMIFLVLWLMATTGQLWWLWTWAVWIVFSAVMLWAYPAFIAPFFNQFKPLQSGSLHQRVMSLLSRNGFSSQGIFVMDGSARSAHGNAYFTGFGANKRIVFFDTLIDKLSEDEIEAVLAHELGHFKRLHVVKRICIMASLFFVALAILGGLASSDWFYNSLGVSQSSNYQALILFMMVAPIFASLLQPLFSALSRKHEFEADDFAATQADPVHLISALIRLYRDNANTLTPDPLYSAFHDSHPPAVIRIAHLREKLA